MQFEPDHGIRFVPAPVPGLFPLVDGGEVVPGQAFWAPVSAAGERPSLPGWEPADGELPTARIELATSIMWSKVPATPVR